MARSVAIFSGVWVAISIPTRIVVSRFLAAASMLRRSELPILPIRDLRRPMLRIRDLRGWRTRPRNLLGLH